MYFLFQVKDLKENFLQSTYLSVILLVSYVSGERMAFATFSAGLFVLLVFLNGFRKSIFLSICLGGILIFLTIYFHPFYNDFKIIESTEYHQGQKLKIL